jgi:hypothetical protein
MMPAEDRGATTPAEDLQFEHADFAEGHAPETSPALVCGACTAPIAETYSLFHNADSDVERG